MFKENGIRRREEEVKGDGGVKGGKKGEGRKGEEKKKEEYREGVGVREGR